MPVPRLPSETIANARGHILSGAAKVRLDWSLPGVAALLITLLCEGTVLAHREQSTTFSRRARKRRYKSTGFIANMEWALEGKPGIEELLASETRFNYILPEPTSVV